MCCMPYTCTHILIYPICISVSIYFPYFFNEFFFPYFIFLYSFFLFPLMCHVNGECEVFAVQICSSPTLSISLIILTMLIVNLIKIILVHTKFYQNDSLEDWKYKLESNSSCLYLYPFSKFEYWAFSTKFKAIVSFLFMERWN